MPLYLPKVCWILSVAPLQELLDLTPKRICLFVDDAADRLRELESVLRNIGQLGHD